MVTEPKPRRISPVVAAGIGAFAGVYSCSMTVMTLPMGMAPVLGIVVAVGVFLLISMADRPSAARLNIPEQSPLDIPSTESLAEPLAEPPARLRPVVNGLVAWAVCTVVGGAIAFEVAQVSPDPWMHQHPVYAIGLMAGGIFGLPVAILVALTSWFQNRHSAREAKS